MASEQASSSARQGWNLATNPWRTNIRLLFLSALTVFTITVGIGIFNGLHIITLDQDVLLTHVHAGTLGWITLSVLAICFWLFGEGQTPTGRSFYVSLFSAISIPLYVGGFLSGNFVIRSIFGTVVLSIIIGFFIWIVIRSRQIRPGIAHLAILGAMFTLIVGSILGVLIQIQSFVVEQYHSSFLPNGAFGAHPATQVVGYLLLIGMAISEWRLMPERTRLPRLGVVQIAFPFIAGLILTVGTLYNLTPLLAANLLLELIGVVIYIVRFAPRIARISWLQRNPERFFAFSGIFIVVNVALLIYILGSVITGVYRDFTSIPTWLIFALDHAIFIGIMSNALFGLVQEASAEQSSFWPWADHILFWGMNFGMVGFVVSLLLDQRILERIFTPIMGASILLAILTYVIRLSRPSKAEQVRVEASIS